MDNFHTLTAQAQNEALHLLEGHPGWRLYCDRFDEIVRKEVDEKIFDTLTSDEDRRTLVAARKLLTESRAPEKMRKAMITATEIAMAREKKTVG
jgi:hypothetical protein